MPAMTKARKIEILADSLVTYILEHENDDFIDWFCDDGWDEDAVCKVLGVKELSEDQANHIAHTAMHEDPLLADCVAYHTDGEHVYADAVKLSVLIKSMAAPKLSKAAATKILEDANDEG